jgi:hypothetical protein
VAKAMCEYIEGQFEDWDAEDSDDIDESWEKFPMFILKVFTSNSWLFSNIIEKSNQKTQGGELDVMNYLVGNFIKSSLV